MKETWCPNKKNQTTTHSERVVEAHLWKEGGDNVALIKKIIIPIVRRNHEIKRQNCKQKVLTCDCDFLFHNFNFLFHYFYSTLFMTVKIFVSLFFFNWPQHIYGYKVILSNSWIIGETKGDAP